MPSNYAKQKERMATDPEYAERIKTQWAEARAKRYANETPEQREKRLQAGRDREQKRYRKLKAEQPEKLVRPKKEKAPKPPTNIRKPGRLLALIGWRGF